MTCLRRIEAADIHILETERSGPEIAGEHSWFGYRDHDHLSKGFESGQLLRDDGGSLAIAEDHGGVIGTFQWRKTLNGPPPYGACWNIGIWILPEHRGKGHGSEAQRLGAAYLFEHTLMERVEASTEIDNLAEQRALERAGFTREGVMRRACFRAGAWRDMVMFSKLRGER